MTGAVGDDEQVFRRVKRQVANQICYKVENGKLIFSASAFNDPQNSPSFDRAELKHHRDPHLSRECVEEGIVSLRTEQIRKLGPIPKMNDKGKPIGSYGVDVVPDPLLGNCAHALVVTSPGNPSTGAFKKLKDGLARLASQVGWAVEPDCELPARHGSQVQDTVLCLINRARGRI